MNYTYSCKEACKQGKPCGNKHCSANPNFIPVKKKSDKVRSKKS